MTIEPGGDLREDMRGHVLAWRRVRWLMVPFASRSSCSGLHRRRRDFP